MSRPGWLVEAGQRLGIHNDCMDNGPDYRFLIQLNRGWTMEHGGLLLLFDQTTAAEDPCCRKGYLPISRSAVAFEISKRSHHAVSRVLDGRRFTITYSLFKKR
jgi:Rps23 Pro-64 3,4-dihydroxylase Tpa1-like proline 4-hydroxylase